MTIGFIVLVIILLSVGVGVLVARPQKFTIHRTGPNLEITKRWFEGKILTLTAGLVVCLAGIWDKYQDAFSDGTVLFTLSYVVVAALAAYFIMAFLFNKTIVQVNQKEVTVRHRPIPYWGQKTVRAAEIKQLRTKETVSRLLYGSRVSYEVHALTHSGDEVKILSEIRSNEQVMLLAQEIEKDLGIKDAVAGGETGSPD
jgi:hypothetical protein